MDARTYLESIIPTREMVDHFVQPHSTAKEIPVNLGGVMCNPGRFIRAPAHMFSTPGTEPAGQPESQRPASTPPGVPYHLSDRAGP